MTSHTKRRIEESMALLNSLLAQPSKKQSTATVGPSVESSFGLAASTPAVTPSVARKRTYLPPRPAVLDKLSRLSASRPTLKDSIAASIAASAPTSHSTSLETAADPTTASKVPPPSTSFGDPLKSAQKRYMPWSRQQFHERLETFKPSTWFDKPKMVNAVECAKRGWINSGDDRLECCGACGGVVIVRVDQESQQQNSTNDDGSGTDDFNLNDLVPEIDMEALGPKFYAMLTENHEITCPWRSHPCDDSIYKFPVVSLSRAREDLLDRVHLLERMASDPLAETIRHPLSEHQVEQLASAFSKVKDTKLLILSVFGWSTLDKQPVLVCEACHAQCTFIPSLQSSSEGGPDGVLINGENSMDEEEDETTFDVAQSHRWYCYWVDPEHDPDHKEGWRTLLERMTVASVGQASSREPAEAPPGNAPVRVEPSEALAQVRRMLRGQAVDKS